MKLLKLLDKYLNAVTMYRLLVYGLSVIILAALALSFFHKLYFKSPALLISAVVILTVGFIVDRLISTALEVNSNNDSSLITCLILICILPPSTSVHDLFLLALGTLIAIASKFVIASHRKHIFNPAAFGALILGFSLLPAVWWIGSPDMLPVTVIFGILVLRKIRRFQLFFSFLVGSLLMAIVIGLHHDQTIGYILKTAIESSPLIFLGSVMLTEPSTTPPMVWQQRIYGLFVGLIFTSQLSVGSVSATPEVALIIGNLYSYIVSPKYKLKLYLKNIKRLAPQIYDFSFAGASNFNFRPGQYLEWTLPRAGADSRGNRRTFSIASAPGEDEIHIAIKVAEKSSSYKKALVEMKPGSLIIAGQLAGDFVLPPDLNQKMVFIAGGIGITPYVSMIKHLIKSGKKRDIILIYLIASPSELCYREIWEQAKGLGLRVIPILSSPVPDKLWSGLTGYLTDDILTKHIPDYLERRYYISGPPGLVTNYYGLLRRLKIGRRSIVTDHFSGY
jgi:ferredoxin-NADP reductase/Na+-translocating ferredoxin:NAD+ oxidoreductase RnfD subunit